MEILFSGVECFLVLVERGAESNMGLIVLHWPCFIRLGVCGMKEVIFQIGSAQWGGISKQGAS